MVIAQVFRGGTEKRTPVEFAKSISDRWKGSCASSYSEIISSGESNGYPYAFWWLLCTKNGAEGRTEHTYAKAIAGKDGFYVVQKAWRVPPKPQDVEKWKDGFFRDVELCDSRSPEAHPCPKGAQVFVPK
jgi:hypothetical protein